MHGLGRPLDTLNTVFTRARVPDGWVAPMDSTRGDHTVSHSSEKETQISLEYQYRSLAIMPLRYSCGSFCVRIASIENKMTEK